MSGKVMWVTSMLAWGMMCTAIWFGGTAINTAEASGVGPVRVQTFYDESTSVFCATYHNRSFDGGAGVSCVYVPRDTVRR